MPTPSNDTPINPYEAPQARNEDTQIAEEQIAEIKTTDAVIPASTQRWMNAAMTCYIISFIVPYAPWKHGWELGEYWTPFVGAMMFLWGLVFCWNPFLFPWWANVFVFLSQRNLRRGNSTRGIIYAALSVIFAISFFVIFWWDGHGRTGDSWIEHGGGNCSAPYFFWLAAMLLQWIAAVDMWQYNLQRKKECKAVRREPHPPN